MLLDGRLLLVGLGATRHVKSCAQVERRKEQRAVEEAAASNLQFIIIITNINFSKMQKAAQEVVMDVVARTYVKGGPHLWVA